MPCTNHPETIEGIKLCSQCQKPFCQNCLVELQGAPFCAECKQDVVKDVQSGVAGDVVGDTEPSPWDRRREIGMVQAIKETTLGVMLHPRRFFSSIHPNGDHGATLGYGVLVGAPAHSDATAMGMGVCCLAGAPIVSTSSLFVFVIYPHHPPRTCHLRSHTTFRGDVDPGYGRIPEFMLDCLPMRAQSG